MGTDLCIWDGNGPTTEEDLFPSWLNKRFPQSQPNPVTRISGGKTYHWESWKPAFVKIRVVCDPCNTRWMSIVENRLKPTLVDMIQGLPMKLSQAEQMDLGFWATMKAYVFDSSGEGPSYASQEERNILRSQQRAPANVRVFLAAYAPGNMFSVHRRHAIGQRQPGDTTLESAHSTTFVLGKLVLRVLGATRTNYRAFERLGEANNRAQTIVPPMSAGAIWPPAQLLDSAALDDFAKNALVFRGPVLNEGESDPSPIVE